MALMESISAASPESTRSRGDVQETNRRMVAQKLLNLDGNRNIDRLRRQTHFVIASLISQLSGNNSRPIRSVGRRLQFRGDLEVAREHAQRLLRKFILLQLGL